MNENRYFGYRSFEPEYETMKEMRKRGIDTVTIMVSNNTNFMGAPYTLGKRGPTRLSLTKQKGTCAAALFENDRGKKAVLIVAVSGKEAECEFTVPGETSLKSRFGKTENLGGGRYRFKGTAASSDVLENQVMEM